ncbi:MAG: hypothetical protein GX088_08105 [Clostridia bacterium]|nr:hypothetical protein [Clostridia bacterium]
MLRCKDILNAAVIDADKAEELGRVKEIIFDLNNRKALAIVISRKNQPFTSFWIDFGFIKEFNDVILLNSNADIIPVSEIQDAKKKLKEDTVKKLWNARVVDNFGKLIGTLEDLFFAVPEGNLQGIELSLGIVSDLYNGRKFISAEDIKVLGKDAVILRDNDNFEF